MTANKFSLIISKRRGYFYAKVNTASGSPAGANFAHLSDRKGKKAQSRPDNFEGNHTYFQRQFWRLKFRFTRLAIRGRGTYSDKLVQTSVNNVEVFYRDAGYEQVEVTASTVDHESKIDVVFHISEGEQTLVDKVEVAGNQSVPQTQLRGSQEFQLRPGAHFLPAS